MLRRSRCAILDTPKEGLVEGRLARSAGSRHEEHWRQRLNRSCCHAEIAHEASGLEINPRSGRRLPARRADPEDDLRHADIEAWPSRTSLVWP